MFDSILGQSLTPPTFLICTGVSLALGVVLALASSFRARTSQSFGLTLAVLPAVVQLVIMLVNGNLGAGVAVAGAFSLVRFRSIPGTAREIAVLFLAMAPGLATGMGYLGIAVLACLLLTSFLLLFTALGFGQDRAAVRTRKIPIPENLDYDGLFDDLFAQYTRAWRLNRVKTANMGARFFRWNTRSSSRMISHPRRFPMRSAAATGISTSYAPACCPERSCSTL